jgi:hypothetical protein
MPAASSRDTNSPSVSAHVEQQFGIEINPGGKGKCPFCGKNTFGIRRDDSLGKCFHPACERAITEGGCASGYGNSLGQILDRLKDQCHEYLLSRANRRCKDAYQYLVDKRQIHPDVLRDSDVGAVPPGYDVEAIFKDALAALEERQQAVREKIEQSRARRLEAKEARKNAQKAGRQRSQPQAKSRTKREKAWEKELSALKEQQKDMEERREELKEHLAPVAGWVAFFHTDASHRVVSICFRAPYSKRFKSYSPFKDEDGNTVTGVFGHGLFRLYTKPSTHPCNTLLLVGGQFDQLQIQSLMVRTAGETEESGPSSYANWVAATGSADTLDVDTMRRLLARDGANPVPVVCHDNDEAGEAMVETLRNSFMLEAVTPPQAGQDIDDFIRGFGDDHAKALQEFSQLLGARRRLARPFDVLARVIYVTRQKHGDDDQRREFEIDTSVRRTMIGDMRERGCFLHEGEQGYYLCDATRELLSLSDDNRPLTRWLAQYGLNATEHIFRYIREALNVEGVSNGTAARIRRFAWFDATSFTLYVSNNGTQMYRITEDDIALVDNGTDGVLFLPPRQAAPFKVAQVDAAEGDLFSRIVTSKINFDPDSRLSVEEQRLLFEYWFTATFFGSLMPTRPIAAFVGPKGSGKTFTFRQVGCLLFGPEFEVRSLPDKEDGFDAVVTGSHLSFFDNADKEDGFDARSGCPLAA